MSSPTLPARFTPREPLGAGASGQVWAAWDHLLGREVALKILRPQSALERRRARREIAALLALDLPGVVRLLDHLEHEEPAGERRVLLVMERVSGLPFPGAPTSSWEALAPRVGALLDVLSGVHAAGLVHRDLKPENAPVEPSGRVVLLDFGLARGRAAGADLTRAGGVVGTPRYLAPEQLGGEAVDGRADLYAVGVMLYELLAGAPPHRDHSLSELWRSRLLADAPSLGLVRPDLPERVIRAVDRLLSRTPEGRFSDAAETKAALLGATTDTRLPWLGDPAPLDEAAARLQAGERVRVGGPRGSGRTRLLAELALRLGERAWPLPPGSLPYESLRSLGAPPEEASPEAAARWAEQALTAAGVEGRIPLLDLDVDPWTRASLTAGAVVVEHGDADLHITTLHYDNLLGLLHGPQRFLHLQEDAAELLLRRSEGVAGRVMAELERWRQEGLARWDELQLQVDREGLERIRGWPLPLLPEAPAGPLPPALDELLAWLWLGWPELDLCALARATGRPAWELALVLEHLVALGAIRDLRPRWPSVTLSRWSAERRAQAERALALALPPGAPGRLRRLLSAGAVTAAVPEALCVAEQEIVEGRLNLAVAALRATLRLVQTEPEAPGEAVLLEALAPVLLELEDERARRILDYELARAEPVVGLQGLVRGWRLVEQGRPREAWAALEALGPLSGRAERSRLAALAAAAQQLPVDEHDVCITTLLDGYVSLAGGLGALPEAPPSSSLLAQAHGWRGLLAYRRRNFGEAARIHLEAARRRPEASGRLNSLLNAAGSALEDGDLPLAEALAAEAEALAAHLRAPLAEGWAALIGRSARIRAGSATAPDRALIADLEALGVPWLHATARSTEATLALRQGDRALAAMLAKEAAQTFERSNMGGAALFAGAIAAAASGDRETLRRLGAQALSCAHDEITLDVLALAAELGVAPRGAEQAARAAAERIPARTWGVRKGVYSVDEALGRVAGGRCG